MQEKKEKHQGGTFKKKSGKAKKKKQVFNGIAYVIATFNNTVISITDLAGNVISWSSAGKLGFSGSKKATGHPAMIAGQEAAKAAIASVDMKEVAVYLKGAGVGRDSGVRGIFNGGLLISLVKDITPIPHNGCRSRKRRRV